MKKILCVMIVVSLLLCSACSNGSKNKDDNKNNSDSKQVEKTDDDVTSDVILPAVEVADVNWDGVYKKVKPEGMDRFIVIEKIGDYYLGYKHESDICSNDEVLLDINTNQIIDIKYPENISGHTNVLTNRIVLKNRYVYKWISYKPEDSKEHVRVLICIDVKTGKAKIIDEDKNFISPNCLCVVDDTHFLSYRVETTSTYTLTSEFATIYDIDGNKKEIIKEKYERDVKLPNSKGNLVGYLGAYNDNIYKLGISKIDGKYKSLLYNYNVNGDLLNEKEVVGLNDIMDTHRLIDLSIVRDYIIFKGAEDEITHICRMTDDGVKLIAKGVKYAVSDKYIYFIEDISNMEKYKKAPLYRMNIDNGKTLALDFPMHVTFPQFENLESLLNKDLLFSYADPSSGMQFSKSIQYIMSYDKLNSLFDKCE